jgi:hypothetical protein
MLKPTFQMGHAHKELVLGVELRARDMKPWRATVEGVRNAALTWRVTAADLSKSMPIKPEGLAFMPHQREVDTLGEMLYDAVLRGRMIDFGYLPNEVIKDGGMHAGPMWNAGAYGQPFRQPWVLYHTWHETEEGNLVAVYLINLIDPKQPTGDFEIVELQPISVGPERLLLIGDRALFESDPEKPLMDKKYRCIVAPNLIRYVDDDEASAQVNNGGAPDGAAAGNVGDPLMTALSILHTRNVERETIRVSDKLQRARKSSGKLPIPPYDRVVTAPYVTAILNRGKRRARSEDHGGHHASPIAHIRRGHPRTYADGSRTFIRDTLVNVSDAARAEFHSTRTHYTTKP